MKKRLLITTFCLCAISSFAQNTFLKYYGQFSGKGNSLIINTDGNYVIAGEKFIGTNYQFCAYEINASGDIVWSKDYGTPSPDQAYQIIQTTDGGYALIGFTSIQGTPDRWIDFVKTTNTGDISWTKQIGGFGQEKASSILQLTSGEYFIGGTTNLNTKGMFDFFLVKTDINGDTLWTKRYGGTEDEEINSMRLTNDGGLILSGYSKSFTYGEQDFYLVKLDDRGDSTWTRHYGTSLNEVARSVRQTSDGGYILTGYSGLGEEAGKMYIVKTDQNGDTLWTKSYGQPDRYSAGNDIIQTADGGYAAVGYIQTASPNGSFDIYLVKFDSDGDVEWEKEFHVEPTNIYMTSSEGRSILQTADGGFAISGYWFSGATHNLLLMKTDDIGFVSVGINSTKNNANSVVAPNPFDQHTNLKFENPNNEEHSLMLFDITGKLIRSITDIKTNTVQINKEDLTSGIYFFKLMKDNQFIATGKLIVE